MSTLAAYESPQARNQIGAVAAGLHYSQSNTRSEPHLRPILQIVAMLDPKPNEGSQGSNLHLQGHYVGSLTH